MKAKYETAVRSHVPYAEGIEYEPRGDRGMRSWWVVTVNGHRYNLRVRHDQYGAPEEFTVWQIDQSRAAKPYKSQDDAEAAMYRHAMCADNAAIYLIHALRYAEDGTHDDFHKIAWRDADVAKHMRAVARVTGKTPRKEMIRARQFAKQNVIY